MGSSEEADGSPASAAPAISEFIAPWTLAGEEVPLLFQWEPADAIRELRVELPPGYEFLRAISARSVNVDGRWLVASDLSVPGYCGLYLRRVLPTQEVLSTVESEVRFVGSEGTFISRRVQLKTVRPKIEFLETPPELVLTDEMGSSQGTKSELVLRLRHTGLGSATLEIQCRVRGAIVSRNQDLFEDVLRRVITLLRKGGGRDRAEYDRAKSKTKHDLGVEVDVDPFSEEDMQRLRGQLMDFLKDGTLPTDLAEDAHLDQVAAYVNQVDLNELNELFREQLFFRLTRQILEGMGRFPSDFTEIQGGPASVFLGGPGSRLTVTIRYADQTGNQYDPIEAHIPIRDERKRLPGPGLPKMIPIKLNIETALIQGLTP
jgi:hypothetical protein